MKKEISFGRWLYNQRRSSDLTRKALADQVGCAEVTLRRIENDTLKPSKELTLILLEELGIPENERPQWIQFARGLTGYPEQPSGSFPTKLLTNLPSLLTTFIGREKEQVEVIKLVEKNRLVTLLGIGGIGKTSFSLQVGRKLLKDYPHGVWFIPLDTLTDPALVPQTIASVFSIQENPARPVIEILMNVLREKTALLILDNCEHLLDACAQLSTILLTNCPHLKILVTSREVLNVTGEAIYQMPSLSIPAQDPASLEQLIEYESVRLFTERATLTQSSFTLTRTNATTVVDICRKLDGIPLAIELAAARVNILQVEEILKQLDDSFALLAGNSRTSLPRHQTLLASMDWSWGLLSEDEQKCMRQLSVFAGGWTLESAQAVCERGVLKLISALVKKSLIVVDQREGRGTRYGFHEVVRQYAREKLARAREEENIRTQHLRYFLRFSERAELALRGLTQVEWMSHWDHERDNIRAALEWADKTDVEAGLYLSGRLRMFWEIFDIPEGARWLERLIQKPESKTYPHARASTLHALGRFLYWYGRLDDARMIAQECLDLYRACGDKYGEVDALLLTALVIHPSRSLEFNQQALFLARSLNDAWRTATALYSIGHSGKDCPALQEAFFLFQKVGDLRWAAECMADLGRIELLNNNIDSAQKILDEATILFRQLNIKSALLSVILQCNGRIATLKGNYEKAYTIFQECAAIEMEFDYHINYLFTRSHMGYLALYRGNITEAYEIFTATARSSFNDKNEIAVVFNLEGVAGVDAAIGKHEIAAQLIGWSDATREKISDRRPLLEQGEVDKIIAACLAKMGEVAFSDAYDEGQKMSLDEAVAYALEKG